MSRQSDADEEEENISPASAKTLSLRNRRNVKVTPILSFREAMKQ